MSLLTNLMETVKPTEEPVVEHEPEQEQEEIKLDGFIQLQKALREMEKELSEPLLAEIAQIESKMAAEKAIVDAYTGYDVAKAAKEPDFDRKAASTMAANADVASQILAGLENDLEELRQKLRDIHAEWGRKQTSLTAHGEQMDNTRRAVAVEFVRSGRLRIDRDHARRWLHVYVAARDWMEKVFGEKYQDAVDYCLDQLSSYEIPVSTTGMLYDHLTPRDRESFPQFKPVTFNPEGQKL